MRHAKRRSFKTIPLPPGIPSVLALLLSTATAFFLTACGGRTGDAEMLVRDSMGVALVDLPATDIPLNWAVERVSEIPPVEEEGDGFFEVTDVTVAPGDRIVVLDRPGKRIFHFDETGNLVAMYGREGSGPGEFQYPIELFVTPDGGVGVFDMMNRRVERFDSTLSPMAPDPFQIPYYGGDMAFAGSFLVAPLADLGATGNEVQVLTAIRETDTVEVARYVRELSGAIELESCGMRLSAIPPLFRPSTRWAAGPDGTVGVAGTERYEIDLYQPPAFSLKTRVRRQVPVIQATRELALEEIGDGMRMIGAGGERVCDANEVVEKRGFAKEIPPITRVVYSPRGELFLERWAREGEGKAIDVLARDGEYLGTLAPGFPFPDAFLGEDRIVVKEQDDLGLTSVAIYRLIR